MGCGRLEGPYARWGPGSRSRSTTGLSMGVAKRERMEPVAGGGTTRRSAVLIRVRDGGGSWSLPRSDEALTEKLKASVRHPHDGSEYPIPVCEAPCYGYAKRAPERDTVREDFGKNTERLAACWPQHATCMATSELEATMRGLLAHVLAIAKGCIGLEGTA